MPRKVVAISIAGLVLFLSLILLNGIVGGEPNAIVRAHKEPSLSLLDQISRSDSERIAKMATQNIAVIALPSGSGGFLDFSAAVPISKDGYYLTAAHSIEGYPTLKVLSFEKSEGVQVSDARLVWIDSNREPDLALIHTTETSWTHLPFDDASELPAGKLVVTSGWAGMSGEQQQTPVCSLAAGTLLSVSSIQQDASDSGCRYRVVTHCAPCGPGDSGGALLSSKGLLGINSHGIYGHAFIWQRLRSGLGMSSPELVGYQAVAYAPEADWLTEIIANDRLRLNSIKD